MARPRSEDKRQTILLAATQLFAEEGLNAPTARIAKSAGVAEGTVFTYFATKDELLNQLYLELKSQLRAAIVFPAEASLKERIWQAWKSYIAWGLQHPYEHQVLAKLGLSLQITATTKIQAAQAFEDVAHLLEEAMAQGSLKNQSPDFVGALLSAMADTTMNFVNKDPAAGDAVCEDGFSAFWRALS